MPLNKSLESELFKALDKVSEYNKLGGRGNGDLEDTCYVCGISPANLKTLIQSELKKQREDIRSKLPEKQPEIVGDSAFSTERRAFNRALDQITKILEGGSDE